MGGEICAEKKGFFRYSFSLNSDYVVHFSNI